MKFLIAGIVQAVRKHRSHLPRQGQDHRSVQGLRFHQLLQEGRRGQGHRNPQWLWIRSSHSQRRMGKAFRILKLFFLL